MDQKFLAIGLLLATVLLAGCTKTPEIKANYTASNASYSSGPFMQCAECRDGQTWNNLSCCTSSFEEECSAKNGVVRTSDLHPLFTSLKGCFQKAPDGGKECGSNTDCLSGVCDLESAANSCLLFKKEFTGREAYGEKFYVAYYYCLTEKPGKCTETVENSMNPGGFSHEFTMNGTTPIERLMGGPIS